MPSPEELAVLESVNAKPAAPEEPTVTMTKGGESIQVPESKHIDYLSQGYDDSRFIEGGEYNPTLSGMTDNILARGEALDRGATGGLGGLIGSAGAATVDHFLPEGGGLGRASAPGMDAAAAPEKTWGDSFHEAEQARRQRADALGGEGLAWELAGGIGTAGAGALAKGGGLAARALAASPMALAEQLGTKAAAKVLGQEAAQVAASTVGKTVAGRALGGLVEGAASGAIVTGIENVDTALKDPWEAAQNVALGTVVGGGMGAVLGGGFGLVEGASRAMGQRFIPQIEKAVQPTPPVPVARDIGVDDAIVANTTRPMTAALVPDPQRGMAREILDQHRALTTGENAAVEEGARALQHGLDETELLEMQARKDLGIAQKRKVNEVALQQGFDKDIVGVDPGDVVHARAMADEADFASQRAAQAGEGAQRAAARRQAALDAEMSARQALDVAEAGGVEQATADLSHIVHNPKRSKEFDGGIRSDTFDIPGDKGSVRVDSGEIPGYATISQIQVPPSSTRQGIGSSLYAKADEFAQSRGLKLASDVQRAPAAESWWKKQVAAGRAEYSQDMDRYILNARTAAPAAKADIRGLRNQLAMARKEVAAASKEFDGANLAHMTERDAAKAASEHAATLATPRPITRLESESRDMYQGLFDSIKKFEGTVAGSEADAVRNFAKRVESHYAATLDAFRRGDYGTAHNLMDQGLKGSLEDLIRGAKSGAVQEYGKLLYKVPQGFLENGKVWGPDIAGRNALANGTWHNNIVASNDAGFKGMYQTVGLDGADNWGNRRGANSAATGALMKQIGEQQAESTEVGVRRALRAKVEDYKNRATAWGDPGSDAIAQKMAKIQTHLEDTLDNTALTRRDAAKARQRMQNGVSLATVGAVAGSMGAALGSPALAAVGLPFVAGRWLLGTVAKYKGDLLQRTVKGAVNLVGTGARYGEKVGRVGNQYFARRMGKVERDENLAKSGTSRAKTIADAQAILDIKSPELGALAEEAERTNALSPGLGDAMMRHRMEAAQYIVGKLPQAPSPAVFSPRPRLANAAAVSLDRTIIAVNGPAQTFERITDGAATPEDLDAMRTLYPGPYKAMTDAIMAEITKNPRRVKSTSLQLYLSRVVGQPLTPALMRLSSSQERAKKATASAEDAGAPEGQGANGSDGVTARAPIQLSTDPNDVYASRADRVTSGQ